MGGAGVQGIRAFARIPDFEWISRMLWICSIDDVIRHDLRAESGVTVDL